MGQPIYNPWERKMFGLRTAVLCGVAALCFLFSLSGHAQVVIGEGSKPDPGTGEPAPQSETEQRVRFPPKYEGHWDFNFHMVFPLDEFHKSDAGVGATLRTRQGAGASLGRYIPFRKDSNLGVYMSLGYFGARIEGLEEVLDDVLDEEDAEGETLNAAMEDYRPRYEVLPASIGLAYESNFDKVDVYARLLLNLSGSYINRFSYRIDGTEEIGMFFPFEWTTGYTVEIGINVANELSLGMAWNYFGTAEFSPEQAIQNTFFPGAEALNDLNFQRRIQTLEIKLGYTIRHKRNRYRPEQ